MYQLVMLQDLASCIWLEGNRKEGDVVWVRSMESARHLVEGGYCRWPKTAPSEVQSDAGPTERKSFGDRTDGPSTDSPLSPENGSEKQSFASAAVLVPPRRV